MTEEYVGRIINTLDPDSRLTIIPDDQLDSNME